MMKFWTVEYKLEKVGRKWAQIKIHGKNGWYNARTSIQYVSDMQVGEVRQDDGHVDCDSNGYGATYTLVLMTDEDRQAAAAEKEAEAKRRAAKRHQDAIEKWWYWVQSAAENDGYIYKRGVEELHALGCHDYDDKIADYKIQIAEEKKRREAMYEHIYVEASHGFRGRPAQGTIFIRGGHCYQVVSSYYYDDDCGRSFGLYTDDYYDCKCIDISDTNRGRAELARAEEQAQRDREQAQREHEKKQLIADASKTRKDIIDAIKKHGELYTGALISVTGDVIYDDFNAYGSGDKIVVDDSLAWYIVNNGMDGDDWSRNNVITGGGGGYAWRCDADIVQSMIDDYIKKEAAVRNRDW